MAREYAEHLISHGSKLRQMEPVRSDCRTTRYKHAIKVISGFFGSGLTRAFESGEGKRKVWTAYAVMTNESGAFLRSFYRVPFKSPTDFEMEAASMTAAPHCVQRLVQIHGMNDTNFVKHLWMVHSAALDRAILAGPPNAKGCYITFGITEILIWRASENDADGWVAVTAIGTDALDGYNRKLEQRVRAGFKDTGVVAVQEGDYAEYLSRQHRMNLAMGLLNVERKIRFALVA